jgi:uncharacterized protein YciI
MCPISALASRWPDNRSRWEDETNETPAPPRVVLYAVRIERGGPWDWSRDMREQGDWDAHASFMDGLVDDGLVLLGGPLEGDREVLHVVAAPSEETIRARFAEDPWAKKGLVTVKSIERWTILLDGREDAGG